MMYVCTFVKGLQAEPSKCNFYVENQAPNPKSVD